MHWLGSLKRADFALDDQRLRSGGFAAGLHGGERGRDPNTGEGSPALERQCFGAGGWRCRPLGSSILASLPAENLG